MKNKQNKTNKDTLLLMISLILRIAILAILCWELLTACKIKPIEPVLQVAPIYQATMVPAEIKYYAPEPTAEPEPVKEEEPSGGSKATITHYCACSSCNGSYSWTEDGVNYTATASGITLHDGIEGNYCAATFGSLGDVIRINGVDYKLVDRMGGNSGRRVDIFVAAGHDECNRLGRYTAEAEVIG